MATPNVELREAQAKKKSLQASRLIPAHIYASLGVEETQVELDHGVSGKQIAEFSDLRLPGNLTNCIRVQPEGFEHDQYKIEPIVQFKTEKGVAVQKTCPVSNFIRWRYEEKSKQKKTDAEAKNLGEVGLVDAGNSKKTMESNTKLVEWSDGSVTLVIGDQQFEVTSEPINRAQCFAQYQKFSLLKGQVTNKLIVKPSLKSHLALKKQESTSGIGDEVKLQTAVESKYLFSRDPNLNNPRGAGKVAAAAAKASKSTNAKAEKADQDSREDNVMPKGSMLSKRRYQDLEKFMSDGSDDAGYKAPPAKRAKRQLDDECAAYGENQQNFSSGSEEEYIVGKMIVPATSQDQLGQGQNKKDA